MKDSRPSKTRLQMRVSSINRQLHLISEAQEEAKKSFSSIELTERIRTLGLSEIEAYYSNARISLEFKRGTYQRRLKERDYFGQPRSPVEA